MTSIVPQQQLEVKCLGSPHSDYHGDNNSSPDVQRTRQRFLMVQAAVTPVSVFPAPRVGGGIDSHSTDKCLGIEPSHYRYAMYGHRAIQLYVGYLTTEMPCSGAHV